MSAKIRVLISLVLIVGSISCNLFSGITQFATPIDPNTSAALKSGHNLLIVAVGNIQLKREKWSDFQKTTFGTIIYRGDLIQLSEGAEAVILCDNLSLSSCPPARHLD